MADRGRDLKFSILSDLSQFDTDKPAKGLEDLADAAEAAGKSVDRVQDSVKDVDLDQLHRDARDAGDSVDQFGDDAKRTAGKVDDAFDKIAKSSRQNLRQKIDDDADHAGSSLHEIRDEANDTAREMGASFSGSADDVQGAFQELAANAGQAFGPVGVAAGAAAAVGLGIIKAKADEVKQLASDLVDEMVQAGGKLTDAAIENRIQQMATDDAAAFVALQKTADDLGLSFQDLARAKAGDGEAADRLLTQVADLSSGISDQAAKAGSANGAMYAQQTRLNALAGELSTTATAYRLARDATTAVTAATRGASDGYHDVQRAAANARGEIQKPIKVPTIRPKADFSNITDATRIAWMEADRYFQNHPITIRTRSGQRPIRDIP